MASIYPEGTGWGRCASARGVSPAIRLATLRAVGGPTRTARAHASGQHRPPSRAGVHQRAAARGVRRPVHHARAGGAAQVFQSRAPALELGGAAAESGERPGHAGHRQRAQPNSGARRAGAAGGCPCTVSQSVRRELRGAAAGDGDAPVRAAIHCGGAISTASAAFLRCGMRRPAAARCRSRARVWTSCGRCRGARTGTGCSR
jgi:hypothetical protein